MIFTVRPHLILIALLYFSNASGQKLNVSSDRSDPAYVRLKNGAHAFLEIARQNRSSNSFVSGEGVVYRQDKAVALIIDLRDSTSTFMDSTIILFLQHQKIPVTVFLSGGWINDNFQTATILSNDSLFEIENGGLTGTLFSNRRKYTVAEMVDEIELNARNIDCLAHRRPLFYLPSATPPTEEFMSLACYLNEYAVSPDIAIPQPSPKNVDDKTLGLDNQSKVVLIRDTVDIKRSLLSVVTACKIAGFSLTKLEHLLD